MPGKEISLPTTEKLLPINAWDKNDPAGRYMQLMLGRAVEKISKLREASYNQGEEECYASWLIVAGTKEELGEGEIQDQIWLDFDLNEYNYDWYGYSSLSSLVRSKQAQASAYALIEIEDDEAYIYLGSQGSRGAVKPIDGPIPEGGSRIPAAFYAEIKLNKNEEIQVQEERWLSPGITMEMSSGIYPSVQSDPVQAPGEDLLQLAQQAEQEKSDRVIALLDKEGKTHMRSLEHNNDLQLYLDLPNWMVRMEAQAVALAENINQETTYYMADQDTPLVSCLAGESQYQAAADHALSDILLSGIGKISLDRIKRLWEASRNVIHNEGYPAMSYELDDWSRQVRNILFDWSKLSRLEPFAAEDEVAIQWEEDRSQFIPRPIAAKPDPAPQRVDTSGWPDDKLSEYEEWARKSMLEKKVELEERIDQMIAYMGARLDKGRLVLATAFLEHADLEGFDQYITLNTIRETSPESWLRGGVLTNLTLQAHINQSDTPLPKDSGAWRTQQELAWIVAAYYDGEKIHLAARNPYDNFGWNELTIMRTFTTNGSQLHREDLASELSVAMGVSLGGGKEPRRMGKEKEMIAERKESGPVLSQEQEAMIEAAKQELANHPALVVYTNSSGIQTCPVDDQVDANWFETFLLEAPDMLQRERAQSALLAIADADGGLSEVTLAEEGCLAFAFIPGEDRVVFDRATVIGEALLAGLGRISADRLQRINRGAASVTIGKYLEAGLAPKRRRPKEEKETAQGFVRLAGCADMVPIDPEETFTRGDWLRYTRDIPGGWHEQLKAAKA